MHRKGHAAFLGEGQLETSAPYPTNVVSGNPDTGIKSGLWLTDRGLEHSHLLNVFVEMPIFLQNAARVMRPFKRFHCLQ